MRKCILKQFAMMKKELLKLYIFTLSFFSNMLIYVILILHKNFKSISFGKS